MKYRLLSLVGLLLGISGVAFAHSGASRHPAFGEEREALAATPYASSGQCGVERWSVKTGTDPDASLVNINSPVVSTISYLRSVSAPSSPPLNSRVQPTETTTYVLDATLVEYKLEGDSDYHLVLKDAQGNTMIAEIPDPACVGAGSPFAAGIQNARSAFDAKYTATTSFKTVNIPVEIKGVGFFDFLHGQTGVAPNGIELHPITDIVFNPSTGGGGGGGNVLQNGVALTGQAAATGAQLAYTAGIPAGASNLVIAISGGTGDADLYTKFGSAPTLSSYDCRPYVTGNSESCTVASPQAGTYYVMLNGYAAFSSVSIKATWSGGGGGNVPPVANFSDTISGLAVNFTDSSTDSDGNIASRSWNFGDSSTSTATNPSHTYAAAGTYTVALTVTDNGGATNTKTQTVTVSGSVDVPPVAAFSDAVNGLIVAFTNTSTDSDGAVVASAWNFGDGSTSSTTSPNHAYVSAGTYPVSLTVTDNGGKTNAVTKSIVLSSGGGSGQLLGNTGFENSTAAPWTVTSGALCTTSGCSGETAHGGTGFVWLDGYGSTHTDTASQTVTIPAGNASATLSFWLHVDTAETTTSNAYDTLKVQVFDTSGTLLGTVSQFSNLDAASGYQQHSVSLSAYIGQTITLKLIGTEDSSYQTSFVVDDVTLNAN